MSRDRPPTIDDVAAAAGVSRSTVSRVINADARVSDAASEAVAKAIHDLDYTPSDMARSLARARTRRSPGEAQAPA